MKAEASNPLVSVVIPVYNAGKYLRETLDSLCNQTLKDIEIICVENGSTDESPAILEKYACRDRRIRIFTLPPVGAGAARNKGIDEARGKYVSMHDADDLFEAEMLETFYRKAESHNADIVMGGMDFLYENKRTGPMADLFSAEALSGINRSCFCPMQELPEHVFDFTHTWTCGKFFRKDFLNSHAIRYLTIRRAEDVPFMFLALFFARTVCIEERVFTHYRQHTSSLSHDLTKEPFIFLEAYRYMLGVLEEAAAPAAVMKGFYLEFLRCLFYQFGMMNQTDREMFRTSILPGVECEFHLLEKIGNGAPPALALEYATYRRFVAPVARVVVQVRDSKAAFVKECVESLAQHPVEVWLEGADPAAGELARESAGQDCYYVNGCTPVQSPFRLPCAVISAERALEEGFPLGELFSQAAQEQQLNLDPYARKQANGRLFYSCQGKKQSWKFFCIPVLSRVWTWEGVRWYLLGCELTSSPRKPKGGN